MTLFQSQQASIAPPVNSPGSIVGLGVKLSEARAACGMTVGNVAEQTNIQPYHLITLEADRELPLAKTFIMGYLRSIARVLDVDPKPWLVHVQEHYSVLNAPAVEEPEVATSTANRVVALKAKFKTSHFRIGSSWAKTQVNKIAPAGLWRTAVVAALPMAFLSTMAFTFHTIDGKFDSLLKPAQPIGGNVADQLGPLAHQVLLSEQEQVHETQVVNPLSIAYQEINVDDESETTLIAASSNPIRLTVPLQNEPREAEPVDLPSREPVPYAAPGAADMLVLHGMQDRLVINVYEDSWIDIRDSEGARLYRDLARAGRRIDVSGDLPFALHLGNAPGLALELNGESVSITRYRADNSARLTLASNQP